ncbi:recombinase [Prevotella sp. P5-92]|uniref:site-specific integrase n=1 Tax=Prevotella sp. P5-92 TaxID=2024222 RepID=UPI000B97078F|nr:site-specific integrase [Prevotella sp. P5-92]OYP54306.1 recombinase [Prevotella sp. P5-92]
MKKSFQHTKCTVKLRKSEAKTRDEWWLIIDIYPIYKTPNSKPTRIKEAVNRTVTTPIWDKTHIAKTTKEGVITYKPKRDANGVIMCRSAVDNDSCLYADKVRAIRQREYDNAELYTDNEAEMAAQNERSSCDYIEYFKHLSEKRHKNASNSIVINWNRVYELLKIYTEGKPLLFSTVNVKLVEDFKMFMLTAPQGGGKSGTVSQNTAATYFSIFKAGLKQAFVDGYLNVDVAAKVKGIPEEESRREHLTLDELNMLAATDCDNPIIKRAALFSALTGLRHVDIQKMKWREIVKEGDHYRVNFVQKKTKGVEYTPISEQAYGLCGERLDDNRLVFEGLPSTSWISKPLERWIKAAGITKHITFHCFRHTFATLQLANGTDIYTISKMLGHTKVETTQIYTKIVDQKKENAADAIKINLPTK